MHGTPATPEIPASAFLAMHGHAFVHGKTLRAPLACRGVLVATPCTATEKQTPRPRQAAGACMLRTWRSYLLPDCLGSVASLKLMVGIFLSSAFTTSPVRSLASLPPSTAPSRSSSTPQACRL